MLLQRPCTFPQIFVIRDQHATLASCSHNFVLAKGKYANMRKAADTAPMASSTVRLRAVFNYQKGMFIGNSHYAFHVTGPAGMMYSYDCASFRCQYVSNRFDRNILRVW